MPSNQFILRLDGKDTTMNASCSYKEFKAKFKFRKAQIVWYNTDDTKVQFDDQRGYADFIAYARKARIVTAERGDPATDFVED